MSNLPEAIIEAARGPVAFGESSASVRARRVINALAENLPESAVEKARRRSTPSCRFCRWKEKKMASEKAIKVAVEVYNIHNPFLTRMDHGEALLAAVDGAERKARAALNGGDTTPA